MIPSFGCFGGFVDWDKLRYLGRLCLCVSQRKNIQSQIRTERMDKHRFLRPSSFICGDSVTEARALNLSCDLFAPAISEPNGQRKKTNNSYLRQ